MSDKKTEEWLKNWRDAANALAKDSNKKVKCPECGFGHLKVIDEIVKKYEKLDRYMICDKCGLWNVLTMKIPDDY